MSDTPGIHDDGFRVDDGPTFAWARRAALVTVIGLAVLLGWTIVTPIDEVSKARGAIEPIAQVRRVESEHGGRVASIDVVLGQRVDAGDVIVRLDRDEAQSALDASNARLAGLNLEIERLNSFVSHRAPQFAQYADLYPQLVAREAAALEAQLASIASERNVIEAQIMEAQAELAAIEAQRPEIQRQIAIAEDEREIESDLVERGLSSRPRLVELTEQEAEYRFDLAQLAGRKAMTEAGIRRSKSELLRIDLNAEADAKARIVEAIAERRAIAAEIDGLQARVDETEIRAPVAGLVQDLPDETSGDVVNPGDMVATVVPDGGGIRFTGRLAPRDVAFVDEGQPVRLKVDSFDFSRYGALEGQVEEISPTTRFDERGNPFYEVQVAVDRAYFRAPEDGLALMPGMTAEADIRTGAKTVFQYVWKPVFTNLDLALSER